MRLQILGFCLSIISCITLLIDFFIVLPNETARLIQGFDMVLCIYFFIEVIYKIIKERSITYWIVIDLISCIPTIDVLRGFRFIRIFRLFKAYKSAKQIIETFYANKAQGVFLSMIVMGIMLLITSSISILLVETAQNSNIKTAEDAVWWSYCTITTVGYGDVYPVTSIGRIIGMSLMTFGVAFFGVLTTYLGSIFVVKKI